MDSGHDSGSGLAATGVSSSQIPEGFVGDEETLQRSDFAIPSPPTPKGWCQLDDIVAAYKHAADVCSHRFSISHSTSGHASKKLGSVLVTDHAKLYCSCPKRPTGQTDPKPHSKSFCPWQVKLKLDKQSMTWNVVSFVDQHCCTSLPDYSITATGMHLLRTAHDLTSEEVAFIHDQFDNVGTYPRLIQWNFTKKFPNRKPVSDLISTMRLKHQLSQYGLQSDNVAALQKTLEEHNAQGGVGNVEWDALLQISRMVVLRPDMVPFLKKYGRVLICDATHGITMAKFRLFTVVVVDSLLHSTLVAYAFVRTEAAVELSWIFKSLGVEGGVVFVSDDNPAARVLCDELQWIHILCQWHYAKNWVKACNKAKITRQEQHQFGDTLFHLMTSVNFKDDADFRSQLNFFCEAVTSRSDAMQSWASKFRDDIELVAEWCRRDVYAAGTGIPCIYLLVYHTYWYTRYLLVYHLTLPCGRCSHHAEKRISQLAHQRRHCVCHCIDGHVLFPDRLLPPGYARQGPRASIR